MALEIRAIREAFVGELCGDDLESLGADTAHALRRAFDTYSVLVAHGQDLSRQALLGLASAFGAPSGCQDITNLNDDESIRPPTSLDARQARANALWHTDMPMLKSPPLAAILLAREIPAGEGNTQFADLAAAWRALPPDRRRALSRLQGVHSIETIRRRVGLTNPAEINAAEYPPRAHPLVCVDPYSGEQSMLFGAHTSGIKGLGAAESAALLEELLQHATQERFVYTHRWQPLDLIVWNNRRTMHRVMPYDDATRRRRLWRAEVVGGRPPSRWPRILQALAIR